MDTKKILIYGGGAIVLGAVTYFVWAFFQKPIIPIGQSTIKFGTEDTEEETNEPIKTGSGKIYDFTPIEFDPIKTPNIYDINNFPLNTSSVVSNP
jgi:hypothetical protein